MTESQSPGRQSPWLRLRRGRSRPLGATLASGGVNFAVRSESATAMSLVLFRPGGAAPVAVWRLEPESHCTDAVWHAFAEGASAEWEYVWRVERVREGEPPLPPADAHCDLLDPHGRGVSGSERWGVGGWRRRRSRVVAPDFEWGDDRSPRHHPADSVVYELQVRGFTRHPSSAVAQPGTFAGLIEKLPYLTGLGVTAVELLPVTEFEENDIERLPPGGERLRNLWGYQPLSFCAPRTALSATGAPEQELKTLVRELHSAGIEVWLDLVFNHTGEGELGIGRTVSWRGLDRPTYYLLDEAGRDLDLAACGNTVRCQHPAVSDLILDSLRRWVDEYHVDGFRFDLAAILCLDAEGREVLARPPLIERVANDPALEHVKLIAEPWDAAGHDLLGRFPHCGRFAEWNSQFQRDVRRFVRGDRGMVPALATRLAGSADLYQGRARPPWHSVNYVTSHDGFTLADLVSYRRKHNLDNGEDNRDGPFESFSWNCGVEGDSGDPQVFERRLRDRKSLAAILLLSQGVPMILAGDEIGRTQRGNNNAYCQDNEISWLDWSTLDSHRDLLRFFSLLIRFRLRHRCLRRRRFARDDERWISWQGRRREHPDWTEGSSLLGMHLHAPEDDPDLFLIFNSGPSSVSVQLPAAAGGRPWRRAIDTSLPSPQDIAGEGDQQELEDAAVYLVASGSVVALVAR